jgi:hypothetical protein
MSITNSSVLLLVMEAELHELGGCARATSRLASRRRRARRPTRLGDGRAGQQTTIRSRSGAGGLVVRAEQVCGRGNGSYPRACGPRMNVSKNHVVGPCHSSGSRRHGLHHWSRLRCARRSVRSYCSSRGRSSRMPEPAATHSLSRMGGCLTHGMTRTASSRSSLVSDQYHGHATVLHRDARQLQMNGVATTTQPSDSPASISTV